MPYLYEPPTWRRRRRLGSGVPIPVAVYRSGGVWHQSVNGPLMDVPIDTDTASGLRLCFTKPMVVPTALQSELAANCLSPAFSDWTAGSLTQL